MVCNILSIPYTIGSFTETVIQIYKFKIKYGKCSKILNTSLSVLNTILVFKAGIHKILVRIASREYTDQTASSEAIRSGSVLFV